MIESIIQACGREGFAAADVFHERLEKKEFLHSTARTLNHESSGNRMAVRAFWEKGDPVGISLSIPSLREIRQALAECRSAVHPDSRKNIASLLPADPGEAKPKIFDPFFFELGGVNFRELTERITEAMSSFSGISIRNIALQAGLRRIHIVNSAGLSGRYKKTVFTISLDLVARHHRLEIQESRSFFRQFQPERLIARASNLFEAVGEAVEVDREAGPLLFAPEATAAVIRHFSDHFRSGFSQLQNKELVASQQVTLVDQPLLDEQCGSAPFDDEGVRCREHILINKGVFLSPIRDLRSGLSAGGSTGNGFRAEGIHPVVLFSNLVIKPSPFAFAQLLKEAGSGVLVVLVRPSSPAGDGREYNFSAYGFRFSGGEVGAPVHFTFRTSLRSFLLRVVRVSRELKFFLHRFSLGTPYMLLDGDRSTGSADQPQFRIQV